ncbi:DUF4097 family beta strand repeat-containing protein [Pseudonocardia sp. GCM10023141]|uniref:DUF4097 family beta strand repeat-containing protein n=1 Tax=Pseudonocardia sp. GCM10023141 TaxID=3252653 RepID=UPI0036219451
MSESENTGNSASASASGGAGGSATAGPGGTATPGAPGQPGVSTTKATDSTKGTDGAPGGTSVHINGPDGTVIHGDLTGESIGVTGSGQVFGSGNVTGDGHTSSTSSSFTSFSDGDTDAAESREESWSVSGPADLEIQIDHGRIDVHLDDADATEVRVEIRHDPGAGGMWTRGLSGIMNWIGNATGGPSVGDLGQLGAEAVRAAEISWSAGGKRLVVRSSKELPLRMVPLNVTVTAPAGSVLAARTGAGDVTVTGRAAKAAVKSGSGRVTLGTVDGEAQAETGSGDIDLGTVGGRASVRSGSGGIAATSLGGSTTIKTGSGDIRLGAVSADLGARTGSGDLDIADARAGSLDITSGSGDLRVAVHPGVAAELDLSSGSGKARSDLEVGTDRPGTGGPALRVRGRTGSGDVLVTRATVAV